MDAIQLANLFVQYASTREQLESLEKQIKAAVLKQGESVNIAGVKATYYKPGEETPDYKSAAESHPDFNAVDLDPYTTVTETVRWKDVCQALGLDVRGEPKAAKVVVK